MITATLTIEEKDGQMMCALIPTTGDNRTFEETQAFRAITTAIEIAAAHLLNTRGASKGLLIQSELRHVLIERMRDKGFSIPEDQQ